MRDEERIEMYYTFGMLDWRNEEKPIETMNSVKTFETRQQNLNLRFTSALNLFLDKLASL